MIVPAAELSSNCAENNKCWAIQIGDEVGCDVWPRYPSISPHSIYTQQ